MSSTWQTAALEFADEPRQTLRQDGEFVLYRGQCRNSINAAPQPALVVALQCAFVRLQLKYSRERGEM
jgi:hypothetical protein